MSHENTSKCFLFHHFFENKVPNASLHPTQRFMHINFNGELLLANQPIFTAENRAFRYGDGLFESIRVFDGKMPFFHLHWLRIEAGIRQLKLELKSNLDIHFFKNEIEKLTNATGNWRVRLSLWRSGGGLYTPKINSIEFLIESSQLPNNRFEINQTGLVLGFFENIRLPVHLNPPLISKSVNALPQVLASLHKTELALDECLLFNTSGRIACASNANVFLVKNSELFTPDVKEGCIAGTMRSVIISQSLLHGTRVNTGRISRTSLFQADEIFLTNAIQGIRWVQQLKGRQKSFGNSTAQFFLEKINGMVAG